MAELDQVPRNGIKPLIVGITGEFYVMLEPFSNLDTENELGKLGVEVRRSTFISEWTKFSFFLNPLGINEKRKAQRAAAPYLNRDIGGDGWESVGEKVLHAGKYDGIVHLAPFTCMPEIIAQNIMPRTKEQIPVLTVLCDEQLAKPGVLTRLEAFVDMLNSKRRAVAMETKGN
jgi:predicted nucleotide-binding protein (sugar kinase/HSP70/actin superfamily)